jgi:hypothetical protein
MSGRQIFSNLIHRCSQIITTGQSTISSRRDQSITKKCLQEWTKPHSFLKSSVMSQCGFYSIAVEEDLPIQRGDEGILLFPPPVRAVTRASIFHAFVRIYIDLHALQPIEPGTMLAVSKLFHTSARASASIFQTFPRISRLVNLTTFQRSTTGHSERAIFPLWHTSLSWTWRISTRCRGRAWCRPGAIKFEACSTCMRLFWQNCVTTWYSGCREMNLDKVIHHSQASSAPAALIADSDLSISGRCNTGGFINILEG